MKTYPSITNLLIGMTIGMGNLGAPAQAGTLQVTVHEEGQTGLIPCRAWVDAGHQRYYKPSSDNCVPYDADRSFSSPGRFTVDLPAGRATLHVERGKEYFPVDQPVDIQAAGTTEVNVNLKRWIHMVEQGWYSADMHEHFGVDNLEILKQQALADDVNLLPTLTYWNVLEPEWPDRPVWPAACADETHLVTLDNQEIERIGGRPFESVGALLMSGLKKPVSVPRHDHQYPCDMVLARIAKEHSPNCVIDTDKPIWAENVITMAFGLFDAVQVCHNHYHRLQNIDDGALCCGMAGDAIEEGERIWGREELFIRTNEVYYRFLNCGFKLAVTGGSAMGVMPVPLGYCRTYAKLTGPFNEANYLAAIHAGNTFATSGPILTMTVDGKELGSTINHSTESSATFLVKADLKSIEPIDAFEIIQNGRIVYHVDLRGTEPSPVLQKSFRHELMPIRSGWVAARAVYRNIDGHLRQAHTSPIYIAMDGKPTAFRRDAEYMIRWVDRVMEISGQLERYQSQSDREESQSVFHDAREVYERIARTATEVWGD